MNALWKNSCNLFVGFNVLWEYSEIKWFHVVLEFNAYFIHSMRLSDAYMQQYTKPSFIKTMANPLIGAKPLSEPSHYLIDMETKFSEIRM